jgi:hypothetical protein
VRRILREFHNEKLAHETKDCSGQQASALSYFDAFLIFTALAIGLAFMVLLMKRSAAQKGQHVAAG